jgi:hypothetical protein
MIALEKKFSKAIFSLYEEGENERVGNESVCDSN